MQGFSSTKPVQILPIRPFTVKIFPAILVNSVDPYGGICNMTLAIAAERIQLKCCILWWWWWEDKWFFSSFIKCLLFADVGDLMQQATKSVPFCWTGCFAKCRLLWQIWSSCTLVHRATVQNCRPVLCTSHKNHREDGCGFNGQREQRGLQKKTLNTQTQC